MKFHIAVISHKRSKNVTQIQELVGLPVTWYVGAGEAEDYQNAGATSVVESGKLCESRNRALDDAFEKKLICVQISDDLKKIHSKVWGEKNKSEPLDFKSALERMHQALTNNFVKMVGVAPTANPFFCNHEVSMNKFIVGDMIMVSETNLRFDERFKLKEDYDYTLQHIQKYGGVARVDSILATFGHRTNPGGAVSYRTSALEQEMIQLLKSKWGDLIRMNSRRENEILLSI